MSPIRNLGVLAFAAAALAVPSAHNHMHLHARQATAAEAAGASGGASPAAASGTAAATAAASASPSGGRAGGAAGGSFGGKRGLDYNTAADTLPFLSSSQIGWAANWVSNPMGLTSKLSYIPTLHSNSPQFTAGWQQEAEAAIASGSQYLFGFNEPDIPSQANMKPTDAASAWKQYMEPFAGKAKLVAPAVSNSASPGQGLDWLKQFMDACQGCTFDAVNQHWYDTSSNDISYFQQQISSAHSQTGLPVFVGEFGFIGSDEEISQSLSQAMNWLDSNDAVVGYAYFMCSTGYLLDGTSPSPYGQVYMQ